MKRYRRILEEDGHVIYELFPSTAVQWLGHNYTEITNFLETYSSRWSLERATDHHGSAFPELVLQIGFGAICRFQDQHIRIQPHDFVYRTACGLYGACYPDLFFQMYKEDPDDPKSD